MRPVLGGYAKSHPQTIDAAQTRPAMRALCIGKITVTPTGTGWSFTRRRQPGRDGGCTRDTRGALRGPRKLMRAIEERHGGAGAFPTVGGFAGPSRPPNC